MARSLAADGYAVAITCIKGRASAERLAAEIVAHGGRVGIFCFDVRERDAVAHAMADIAGALGPIDVVVSNAMSEHFPHPVEEQRWEQFLDLLEFSVKAPLSLLQSVLPAWKARKSGCFINIGSESFDLAKARSAAYLAAKAAMIGLTRSWAQELGPFNIRVNLVAPGFIPVERHSKVEPTELDNYAAQVPLRRMGTASEIADVVGFLASSRASFVTGQVFHVNGGRTMT